MKTKSCPNTISANRETCGHRVVLSDLCRYVEWEKYPDKKAVGHEILISHKFPPNPEFQLGPIPNTNPVLEGVRWKLWHTTIGGALKKEPDESWKIVLEEKHPEMVRLGT